MLSKILHNKLISSFFEKYIMGYEVNEGALIKKHRITRKTLLGKIIDLPPSLLNFNKQKVKKGRY